MSDELGEILLRVQNVSIGYMQGDFRDIGLKEWVTRHLTRNYHVEHFMAVDGVSFDLRRGELLGIVGTNGAGKSTLLKAIAGIMEPREGSVVRAGAVSALLELGSGFDGELTVKENAYLRGAMLGYTHQFMDETYQQIIAFAQLEGFEDRPFKQLSTGMQSRLAFSIASLVQPEILILDEVLSVGDGAFQEKSARKMREIIQGGATTILVSHSLAQIRELSTKVLWLHHGRQIALGDTETICNRYQAFLDGDESALEEGWLPPRPPEDEISALMPLMRGTEGSHRLKNFLLLPSGTVLYGPYLHGEAGEYTFRIELDSAGDFAPLSGRFTANVGQELLAYFEVRRGENILTLSLSEPKDMLELVVYNGTEEPIFLLDSTVEPPLLMKGTS